MLIFLMISSSTFTLLRVLNAFVTLNVTLVFPCWSFSCSVNSGSGNSWMQDMHVRAAMIVYSIRFIVYSF